MFELPKAENVLSGTRPLLAVVLIGSLLGCGREPTVPPSVEKASHDIEAVVPVDHLAADALETADAPFSAANPTPSEPVTAIMTIRPASATAGELVEVRVLARIAAAHYLHAADNADKTFAPVMMTVALPKGIEAVGEWQLPAPVRVHAESRGYIDSILLRRSLKVLPSVVPQTVNLTGALSYQACTPELCWPPGKIELSAPLTIRSPTR